MDLLWPRASSCLLPSSFWVAPLEEDSAVGFAEEYSRTLTGLFLTDQAQVDNSDDDELFYSPEAPTDLENSTSLPPPPAINYHDPLTLARVPRPLSKSILSIVHSFPSPPLRSFPPSSNPFKFNASKSVDCITTIHIRPVDDPWMMFSPILTVGVPGQDRLERIFEELEERLEELIEVEERTMNDSNIGQSTVDRENRTRRRRRRIGGSLRRFGKRQRDWHLEWVQQLGSVGKSITLREGNSPNGLGMGDEVTIWFWSHRGRKIPITPTASRPPSRQGTETSNCLDLLLVDQRRHPKLQSLNFSHRSDDRHIRPNSSSLFFRFQPTSSVYPSSSDYKVPCHPYSASHPFYYDDDDDAAAEDQHQTVVSWTTKRKRRPRRMKLGPDGTGIGCPAISVTIDDGGSEGLNELKWTKLGLIEKQIGQKLETMADDDETGMSGNNDGWDLWLSVDANADDDQGLEVPLENGWNWNLMDAGLEGYIEKRLGSNWRLNPDEKEGKSVRVMIRDKE